MSDRIPHMTVDYASGRVLIDGKPINCPIEEAGPEVVSSPCEGLYIVNVPLMVSSITWLPSGEVEGDD